MIYTFYLIYHKYYGNLYVGSTTNLQQRKYEHKSNCFNEKSKTKYDLKLYKFIRENNILWNDLEFQILMEAESYIPLIIENLFIQQHNTIENGLNSMNACKKSKMKFFPPVKQFSDTIEKQVYNKINMKTIDGIYDEYLLFCSNFNYEALNKSYFSRMIQKIKGWNTFRKYINGYRNTYLYYDNKIARQKMKIATQEMKLPGKLPGKIS